MEQTKLKDLRQLKRKLAEIEKVALEVKEIGKGVPVVEKNVRSILSTVYVLKFGITDIVDCNFN